MRVLRDGRWQLTLAQDLVPGDVVHVRMGDLIPADLLLHDGHILVDQSALTGESTPGRSRRWKTAYAGSTVRRGEATGEVTATGRRTYYGKTAELVRTASTPSHLEALIFTIVKYLVALDVLLVVAILVYAVVGGIPLAEIIPFALILLDRFGSGGPPGDLHPGQRPGFAGTGQAWGPGDTPLRRRGGGGDGRAVQRQDRDHHQKPVGRGDVAGLLSLHRGRSARTGGSRL